MTTGVCTHALWILGGVVDMARGPHAHGRGHPHRVHGVEHGWPKACRDRNTTGYKILVEGDKNIFFELVLIYSVYLYFRGQHNENTF